MTIANWCILAAAILPNLWSVLSKTRPDYDNRLPRQYEERLIGWRQRAHWTHLNSIESFAPFAAGVLVAQQTGATQSIVNGLAMAFVAARLCYGLAYLANVGWLRSLIYITGLGCVVGLFVAAIK